MPTAVLSPHREWRPTGKRIRCVGLAHAQDDIFAISNCMYCENFTLKTLRASLAFFLSRICCSYLPRCSRGICPPWSRGLEFRGAAQILRSSFLTVVLHPTRKHETTFPLGWRIFYIPQPPTRATLSLWKFCRCIPHLTRFGEPAVVPLLVNAPVSEWI